MKNKKVFVAYFFFVSWSCISLGLHIDFKSPNIEVHLLFGFFRIGWEDIIDWGEVGQKFTTSVWKNRIFGKYK